MNAETAYLFRHALLRDAAYQLQLPADRARLHEFAFELVEEIYGGRPEDERLGTYCIKETKPLAIDDVADELVFHLRQVLHSRESAVHLEAERVYLRRAAEHSERRFHWKPALEHWLGLADRCAKDERAAALMRAGSVASSLRDGKQALELLEKVLAEDAPPDSPLRIAAIGNLARVQLAMARLDEALNNYQVLAELGARKGDRLTEARALSGCGHVHMNAGRAQEAEDCYRRSSQIANEIGNTRSQGITLGNLAFLLHKSGRVEEARENYRVALGIHQSLDNRVHVNEVLGNKALLEMELGNLETSSESFRRLRADAIEMGDRRLECVALVNLGAIEVQQKEPEVAQQLLASALAISQEMNWPHLQCHTQTLLSEVHIAKGSYDMALELAQQAHALGRKYGYGEGEALALSCLASANKGAGRSAVAEEHIREAIARADKARLELLSGQFRCELALLLVERHQEAGAREAWRQGLSRLHKFGNSASTGELERRMKESCTQAGIAALDQE